MVRSPKMWAQFILFWFSSTHYTRRFSICKQQMYQALNQTQTCSCTSTRTILTCQKFIKMIICECFNEIILTQRQKKQQKGTRKPWVNYLNLKASTKISKENSIVYFCFNTCDTSHRYIFFTCGAIKDLFETWMIVRKAMLLH